jgi:hypothetical protein
VFSRVGFRFRAGFIAASLVFAGTVAQAQSVIIAPRYTTVAVKGTVQYKAIVEGLPNSKVTWSVSGGGGRGGTIDAHGLYTAPAAVPAYGVVISALASDRKTLAAVYVNVVQADSPELKAASPSAPAAESAPAVAAAPAEPVSHAPAVMPHIDSIGNEQLPLGIFNTVVNGTGFGEGSVVRMNGAVVPAKLVKGALNVSGFYGKAETVKLTVSNGSMVSDPVEVRVGVANAKASPVAARRFLEQAGFGPNSNDAMRVQELGIEGWLKEQFEMPQISNYDGVTWGEGGTTNHFLTLAVNNKDQLRQRVAFTLSQIFVVSGEKLIFNTNLVPYQNMLMKDCFLNFRKIMEDVTLSPAMGQYLDMANNAKANPARGSLANENFAREIMQLFTMGTVLLNEDGTEKHDAKGLPIPAYTQADIGEFAKVYTGWTFPPAKGKDFIWPMGPYSYNGPMIPFPAEHDFSSKKLLNGFVSPAKISPEQDLKNALDNIFNHPNTAPFVCGLLIRHMVKSNPSPEYVARVVRVFNDNGQKVRGDMRAVVAAILLDPEARENDEGDKQKPSDGHLVEPALFIAGMVRAFNGHMDDGNYYHHELENMGETVFYSPSVFNFYEPNYEVPGTSLSGGEFEIYTPTTAMNRSNQVAILLLSQSTPVESYGPGTSIDFTPFLPLANDPVKLVDALDLTLTHGAMPAGMKAMLVRDVQGESGDMRRIQVASYLILTSSYYNVWH